ncbi:trypsin-like serine peptidase [Actinacidiphila sp. bgisy144]|uniref:trypsin-like serine peptidase n=1 Tax=unclassified Actinacidiphila TaxID=2995708 RepID=UPI003EBB437E
MKRTAAYLGALTLAATAWTVGTAHAAPSSSGTTTSSGSVERTTFSTAQQDKAIGFWTPERLRAAKDVSSLTPAQAAGTAANTGSARAGSAADPAGPEVSVPPAAAPASPTRTSSGAVSPLSSPTAWTGGGLIATTAGKVFFQNAAGGTYACSATVANSDNKSVVLTAGHCVVDASTGEVYQNWVFIPGYANGNRPYGTFAARSLFHDGQYVSTGGNANWDYGFAAVGTVNGSTLVDTVGAQGIAFNSATGQHVHSFGYGGSDAEGNGERLNHCEGDEFADAGRADSTMWGIDCVQTGGSSGGGFLASFDSSAGSGYLVGNISVSSGSNEYHPVLGNSALSVYQQAGAA